MLFFPLENYSSFSIQLNLLFITQKTVTHAYRLFWIKGTWEIAATRRTHWPSFVPLKGGDKSPMRKVTFLYQGVRSHSYHKRQGIWSWKGYINKSCYFFAILLCLAQAPFSCQFFHEFIIFLKSIKLYCSAHFFKSHIFMGSHRHEIKFFSCQPSSVNLIIRAVIEPRREGKNFPSLHHSVLSCSYHLCTLYTPFGSLPWLISKILEEGLELLYSESHPDLLNDVEHKHL